MKSNANFDFTRWEVHDTETDCNLIFRSTLGQVFYCHINPDKFIDSPTILGQYLKCLQILRTGEQEIDGFYDEDAYEWLTQSFAPLITQLVQSSGMDAVVNPTLAHYLFPSKTYNIQLLAVDDELKPEVVDFEGHGWINSIIEVDDDFLRELDQWTRSYAPSNVQLCYDRPEDIHWLHEEGIVWGDAKPDNVLIDKDENAWIIDFGGSYTPGWVDEDKAETFEGDYQGKLHTQ
ncbi:hypothetical protein FoTM2_014725 [Fusarium oxysporum f. sp. vasinfectum]|nr:hypothetical protein FoTM2_014725 [Fusarium oxysporum f. sp. vasinfectum]